MSDNLNVDSIAYLAREGAELRHLELEDGSRIAYIPQTQQAIRYRPEDDPNHHIRSTTVHNTTDSLIGHLEEFGGPGTVLVVDLATVTVSAVLDHDIPPTDEAPAGVRGHKTHVARLSPVETAEWKLLTKHVNTWMSREAFAEFVYRMQPFLRNPLGVLEVAEQINVSRKVEFSAGAKVKDGARTLNYVEETTKASGGAGSLELPDEIHFDIVPHYYGPDLEVETRFRYRLREAALEVRLDCFDIDDLIRNVLQGYADEVLGAVAVRVITGAAQ